MKTSHLSRVAAYSCSFAIFISACGGGGSNGGSAGSGGGGTAGGGANGSGATFAVNTTADLIDDNTSDGVCHTIANTCSLRAAIMQANHSTALGLAIISVPAGIYTLSLVPASVSGEENGDLNLTKPLVAGQTINIAGAGAGKTIIDANFIDGVFQVETDRVATISNVTIRNGSRPVGPGGGILNGGTLSIIDSVIENNSVSNFGGGIYNNAILVIDHSTVRGNTSAAFGGGLFLGGGVSTVRNSTFDNNTSGIGGGIYNNDYELTVVTSTLSANKAKSYGGGIASVGGAGGAKLTALYNTTIVGNEADSDHDGTGVGGGIFIGGGVLFRIVNTLLAGNPQGISSTDSDCSGTVQAYGWNLLGSSAGCTFTGNGAAARGVISASSIAPLADYGGLTWTRALKAGSLAIDATLAQGCVDETGALLTTDQRGAPRVAGARCDVGAFEFGAVVPQ